MNHFWTQLTKQEKHLALATLFLSMVSCALFYLNHKDVFIIAFYFVVVLITLVVMVLSAWILHKTPYLPRIMSPVVGCTFLAMIFGLPLQAALCFVTSVLTLSIVLSPEPTTKPPSIMKKVCLLAGLLCVCYLLMFFISKGNEVEQYPAASELEIPAKNDTEYHYKFEHFTYGSGTDINREEYSKGVRFVTQSVNAEKLVDNWQGFSGWYRSHYWGFDLTNLPLNAHTWMPVGDGKFPIVFIVHGDHAMQDYSEKGYAYLAEHLAQLGYIVVSIDQNFLNRSWSDLLLSFPLQGENDARAWLMLEHANVWKNWSKDPTHPLFNKIDTNNIALIGHSRGGEAAAVAATFSQLAHLPEDPEFIFNYDFEVKSVVAIAPVDGQYRPKGKLNKLSGVNYLLLQGSQDGEMNYAGAGQYSRTDMSHGQPLYKFAHYVYGANHGQFNSSWGENDQEFFSPYPTRWNLAELMPEPLQKNIAKQSITHFLELTIKQDEAYLAPLKAPQSSTSDVPVRAQHSDSKSQTIQAFQPNATHLTSQGLTYDAIERIAKGSHAQKVKWDNCAPINSCWLKVNLVQPTIFAAFNLDIANNTQIATDIKIEITFTDSSTTIFSLSDKSLLPPRLDRVLKKSVFMPPNIKHEIVFTTYRFDIPVENMHKDVANIKFIFENAGEVYIDNLTGVF